MVRQGFDPGVPQRGGHVLRLPAGEAVHDRGLPRPLAQHGRQHGQRTPLRPDPVADVRAVEARDQELGVVHPQPCRDVGADTRGRGGGQRHEGDFGNLLAQRAQGQVVGPELVSPLRDAVRLVHRDETDAQPPQEVREAGQRDPFGRHVEQLEITPERGAPDLRGLVRTHRAVQAAGGDAAGAERVHLVLHERDQRRDHERQPVARERRKLVAERLAAAGGHEHHGVPSGEGQSDGALLQGTEGVVPEVAPEERPERILGGRSLLPGAVARVCRVADVHRLRILRGASARMACAARVTVRV